MVEDCFDTWSSWGVVSCALPWPLLVLELHAMRQPTVLDDGLPDVEGDLADTAGLVGLVLDVRLGGTQ